MAKVRFDKDIISAKPISQEATTGDWLMEAQQHGPRYSPGTVIRIPEGDVLHMDDSEKPANDGQAQLEAAMAQERKTLPSPAEMLAKIAEAAKPVRAAEADAVSGERARPFP
jgi:hypothetical protein